MNGYLVKHALLHVGCHDGVDGDNGGPQPAAPPQQVPEMLLRLAPLALEWYIILFEVSMALNLNGFNFNQSVVDSQGREAFFNMAKHDDVHACRCPT